MSIPCTVYIDEAGDLGANRGTNWFVLTAVVVDATEEPKIRTTLKNIKLKLNLQNIHFRTIKDFNRRCYIVQELSQNDFTYVNILFDTTQMDKEKMPTDVLAYNYICRYLIERVSWFMRDTDRRGKIVLSSRGTTRDAELIDYIANKLIPYEGNNIAQVFSGVECKPASQWDLLQLADVCATSMFFSHETNGYGFVVPCFAYKFADKLYRHDGALRSYGIKYFSNSMQPPTGALQKKKICYK